MSFHRENVVWQSENETWNRGFYEVMPVAHTVDDDYDPEWDAEYDMDRFEWVRTGLKTVDAAQTCWEGANPGGNDVVPYTPENVAEVNRLDRIAAEYAAREQAHSARTGRTSWW
jgi:hypothetical protein